MNDPRFSSLLAAISQQIGVDLTLQEDEMLVFEMEGGATGSVAYDDKTSDVLISLDDPVPPTLDVTSDDFMSQALRANYRLFRSQGISLGFIEQTSTVRYSMAWPIQALDAIAALECLNQLAELSGKIPEVLADPDEDATETSS